MKNKKSNRGFTLVELLVVIAIIGILAVVAVPALFKNINKAKVADLQADYNAFKSASLSYYTDENTYPTMITIKDDMESVPKKSPLSTDGTYELKEVAVKDGTLTRNIFVLESTKNKISRSQAEKLANDFGESIRVGTGNDSILVSKDGSNLKGEAKTIQLILINNSTGLTK